MMKNPGLLLPNENTIAVRLLKRIRKELSYIKLPRDAKLVRLYPGHWQRARGAWSWASETKSMGNSLISIGSIIPMTECLRAKKLIAYVSGPTDYELWRDID